MGTSKSSKQTKSTETPTRLSEPELGGSQMDLRSELVRQQAKEMILGDEPLAALADAVRHLSAEDMKLLRSDEAILGLVRRHRAGNAIMATLLQNSVGYQLPDQSTFGETPGGEELHGESMPSMNCWQFAQHADVLSGKATPEDIARFRSETSEESQWWERGSDISAFGYTRYVPGEAEPAPGDCVVVCEVLVEEDSDEVHVVNTVPGHVMVSLGGSMVMSHDGGSGDVAQRESLTGRLESFENAQREKRVHRETYAEYYRGEHPEWSEARVSEAVNGALGSLKETALMFGRPPWRPEEVTEL